MHKEVSFPLAKLIKEKGFDKITESLWHFNGSQCIKMRNKNSENFGFSAPTIADVVCWIYSKYDIWISLIPDSLSGHKLLDRKFSVSIFRFNMNLNVQAEILRKDKNILYFNLPENAFEYAITNILNTYKPIS